jgi:hypothetical protein
MKRSAFYLVGVLMMGLVVITTSCSKKKDVGSGLLMVVNASPAFGPVDVNIDSKLYSGAGLASPGNTPYTTILEGSHPVRILAVGGTTTLLSLTLTTVANSSQSLYIYDRPSSLQQFAVEDMYTTPTAGQCNIRFFNLAASTPQLDLGTLNGSTFTSIFTNRNFETSSTAATSAVFTSYAAGTYKFDMKVSGTGVSLATIDNVVLQSGKTYTIYARGVYGNIVTPLGLTVIEH